MRNNTVVIVIISFSFIFCRHGMSTQVGEPRAEITIPREDRMESEGEENRKLIV